MNAKTPSRIAKAKKIRSVMRAALHRAQITFTDEQLSLLSGIPARTIKSYRVEGKIPSLDNALSMLAVLGPDAMNAVLSTVRYAGARPMDEVSEVDPRQIVANLLQSVATIAAAAADGRFDHTELPSCREAADHIIATVLPLSSSEAGNGGS